MIYVSCSDEAWISPYVCRCGGLAAGLASGCLVATESEENLGEVASPIFDGTASTKDQIFSTVALLEPGNPYYICSGILLAPSVVVTAAHCIDKDECQTEYAPYDLTVVAGTLDATAAGAEQSYEIAKMIPYPGFVCPMPAALDMAGDLAIVILKGSVTKLSPVPTATFDKIKSALSTGTLVTIEGYGDRGSGMTQFGSCMSPKHPISRQALQSSLPAPCQLQIRATAIRAGLSTLLLRARSISLA